MTELELARYAYHNCELEAAMRYCEWARHTPAAAVLRVKSLCELDRAVAARSEAEAALALFPDDGPLHYYTGMATYLAGGSREEISGAFEAALERGFAGGAMGRGSTTTPIWSAPATAMGTAMPLPTATLRPTDTAMAPATTAIAIPVTSAASTAVTVSGSAAERDLNGRAV